MGGDDDEDEGDESDDELPGLVEETPAEANKVEVNEGEAKKAEA